MAAIESLDPAELAHYESSADLWWDKRTVAGWLHKYIDVRVPYIADAACRNFGAESAQDGCLRHLRILDIGCGGGVLCEPLARLGADVTGVDPAGSAIRVAKQHAEASRLDIDYQCSTIEELAREGKTFDIVLAMEVAEHVAHVPSFLGRCGELVRPGGLLILSTINRTWKSYAFAIVMGEYVLRLLPRGAHQWAKFVRPEEIAEALQATLLSVVGVSGVTMNLTSGRLQLSRDKAVNYMITARKEFKRS